MATLAELERARADRDAARGSFDILRGQVQSDVDARGVGTRVTDRAKDTATDIFIEAIELADAHRGIVGGTIAVLALWFLRNPIIAGVRELFDLGDGD